MDTDRNRLGPFPACRTETVFLEQKVADALSCRISFGQEDAAVIDWHSAVLFGKEMDDVRAVLEFANGSMGREHPPQTTNAGKHLRQDV